MDDSFLFMAAEREDVAYDWFESIRWPDGPVCPHCGAIGRAYYLKPRNRRRESRTGNRTRRKVWKCGCCRKQFTVTVGTCMERGKIPLDIWVSAFLLLSDAEDGVTTHQLSKGLRISPEAARFMVRRLRHAFAPTELQHPK